MMTSTFSPREFLRCRQAVLVHFSTLMASRVDLAFPDDIGQGMTLTGVPLSFSTIQVGDTNPQMQGRGGAEGSVGMLVDIGPGTLIHSVSPSDSGSSLLGSLGLRPTEQNCIDSIDKRATSNEWHVQDYVPLGIFVLPPIWVRQIFDVDGAKTPVEVQLDLAQAIAPFGAHRIFSANTKTFLEYNRGTQQWLAVTCDQILTDDGS